VAAGLKIFTTESGSVAMSSWRWQPEVLPGPGSGKLDGIGVQMTRGAKRHPKWQTKRLASFANSLQLATPFQLAA